MEQIKFTKTMQSSLSSTAYAYQFFQSGIVFTCCLFGLVILVHVTFRRPGQCCNRPMIFTTIAAGLAHVIGYTYVLCFQGNAPGLHGDENQDCHHLSLLTSLTNAVTSLAIGLSIIQAKAETAKCRVRATFAYSTSIVIGVVFISGTSAIFPPHEKQGETWTLESFQVNMNWTVCMVQLVSVQFQLIAEYTFINLPLVAVVVLLTGRKSRKNESKKWKLQILRTDCLATSHGHGVTTPCVCSKINDAFAGTVVFWVGMVILARPAMILYTYEPSGYFRDMLMAMTLSVTYIFICLTYLVALYEIKADFSKQRNKCVMHV